MELVVLKTRCIRHLIYSMIFAFLSLAWRNN